MDLVVRNAQLAAQPPGRLVDIGIAWADRGHRARLAAEARELDAGGRLVSPGFETHIHLDKSCIVDRCDAKRGDLDEAIRRRCRAVKQAIHAGGRLRARPAHAGRVHPQRHHAHAHPARGRSRHRPARLRGHRAADRGLRWAIDIEICVFPQEGLLNNPGTDELMVEALKRGARWSAARPTTDTDRAARSTGSSNSRANSMSISTCISISARRRTQLDLEQVCDLAERYRLRRAHRHRPCDQARRLSPQERFDAAAAPAARCRRGADGAALDRSLLMGRDPEHGRRAASPPPTSCCTTG